jgi:hypothetical protein
MILIQGVRHGKELVWERFVVQPSGQGPFVIENCGAIPEKIYWKPRFSGLIKGPIRLNPDRLGYFQAAKARFFFWTRSETTGHAVQAAAGDSGTRQSAR